MNMYFGANDDLNFSHIALIYHHILRFSQNITIAGVLMNGNCYTYPLILPDIEFEHPEANLSNPKTHVLMYDENFIQDLKTATLHAINEYCKARFTGIEKEPKPISSTLQIHCFELRISEHFDDFNNVVDVDILQFTVGATPFREIVFHTINIKDIFTGTECIL